KVPLAGQCLQKVLGQQPHQRLELCDVRWLGSVGHVQLRREHPGGHGHDCRRRGRSASRVIRRGHDNMNRFRNLAWAALAGVFAFSLVGCGKSRYVPISGVVTLNGKPYHDALVQFQPMATRENPEPGRASSARTDENGRFTLKSVDGHEGAVVGKHRIRIWPADLKKGEKVKAAVEPFPLDWNSNSDKEFVVPAGGTDKANFDIVTAKH